MPLVTAAVAAIGYGVTRLQHASYTSQATVVVSSAGSSNLANAQQADTVASSYAVALPQDDKLHQFVARRTGVPTNNAISVLPSKGSVVRLRFAAGTRRAALRGARALANALTGPNPVSNVVGPGTLKLVHEPNAAVPSPSSTTVPSPSSTTVPSSTTGTASGIVQPSSGRFHSDAVMIVPAQSGPSEGLNADDAGKLAVTYAGLIPIDTKLLTTVARATGQSTARVGQSLSVANQQNTSILQISFTSSDPRIAATGARTAARLVVGPNPVVAGVVPASVSSVALPTVPATAGKAKTSVAVVGGAAVIGLVLGIVLLIAWERSDPRVRDPRDLSAQIGCPATPVERLSPNAAAALLERWTRLTDHVPARVAVLPADASIEEETTSVVNLLRGSGLVGYVDAQAGLGFDESIDAPDLAGKSAVLVHAGPAGGEGSGEAVALGCDLAVIVVGVGTRASDVRRLADELANFGIVPVWALLAPGGYRIAPRQEQLDAVSA